MITIFFVLAATITFLISFITITLLIWFNSDALVEYGKVFGLKKQLKIDEYEIKKMSESYPLSYPRFLRITHDGFAIKLVTCTICFAIWLSIILSIILSSIIPLILSLTLGISTFIAFIIFPLLIFISIPISSIGAMILYGTIVKLLGLK